MKLSPEDRIALILGRAVIRTQILEAQLEAVTAEKNAARDDKEAEQR